MAGQVHPDRRACARSRAPSPSIPRRRSADEYTVYGNAWLVERSGVVFELDAVVVAPHARLRGRDQILPRPDRRHRQRLVAAREDPQPAQAQSRHRAGAENHLSTRATRRARSGLKDSSFFGNDRRRCPRSGEQRSGSHAQDYPRGTSRPGADRSAEPGRAQSLVDTSPSASSWNYSPERSPARSRSARPRIRSYRDPRSPRYFTELLGVTFSARACAPHLQYSSAGAPSPARSRRASAPAGRPRFSGDSGASRVCSPRTRRSLTRRVSCCRSNISKASRSRPGWSAMAQMRAARRRPIYGGRTSGSVSRRHRRGHRQGVVHRLLRPDVVLVEDQARTDADPSDRLRSRQADDESIPLFPSRVSQTIASSTPRPRSLSRSAAPSRRPTSSASAPCSPLLTGQPLFEKHTPAHGRPRLMRRVRDMLSESLEPRRSRREDG